MKLLTIIIAIFAGACLVFGCRSTETGAGLQANDNPANKKLDCQYAPDESLTPQQRGEYELRCRYLDARPQYYRSNFELIYKSWSDINAADLAKISFKNEILERYGLFYDDVANKDLPVGLNETLADYRKPALSANGDLSVYKTLYNKAASGLSVNCLSCHAAILPSKIDGVGQVAVGIGNVFFNYQQLHEDLKKTEDSPAGILIQRNPGPNSMVNSADYFGVVASYLRRDYPKIDANHEMFPIFFRPDPFNEHVLKLANLGFSQPYLKTQPWVNFKYKEKYGLYVDGGFHGNPAAVTYRLAFSKDKSGEDYLEYVNYFRDSGPAYFRSLQPPSYPFPINKELTQVGHKVYQENCASCHGNFTDTAEGRWKLDYPGVIRDIATDNHRYEYFTKQHGAENYSAHKSQELNIVYNKGYIAPPLVGIWARAPFLHNGSIPNIRQLLSPPARRVKKYALYPNPTKHQNYDQKNLGWQHVDLNKTSVAKLSPHMRVYNPDWVANQKWLKFCQQAAPKNFKLEWRNTCDREIKVKGLTNTGHDLQELTGDYLSEKDLDALIEFLKGV